MQEKSDRTQRFLDRFSDFTVRFDLKTAEACREVGISRSLFYELRDGKREVTAKMEDRLAEAERRAGIGTEAPGEEVSEDAGDKQAGLDELSGRLDRIETLLAEVLDALSGNASHDATSSRVRGRKF